MCLFLAGGALVDFGESMKRMAEVKDSLDIDVKQNFIDPLQAVAEKDIRDIQVQLETSYLSADTSSRHWLINSVVICKSRIHHGKVTSRDVTVETLKTLKTNK